MKPAKIAYDINLMNDLLQVQAASLVPAPEATPLLAGQDWQFPTLPPLLHSSTGQFLHPAAWSRYCPWLHGSGSKSIIRVSWFNP